MKVNRDSIALLSILLSMPVLARYQQTPPAPGATTVAWAPSYSSFDCKGQLTINVSISEGGPELFIALDPIDASAGDLLLALFMIPKLSPNMPSGKLIIDDHSDLLKQTATCAVSVPAVKEEGRRLALHVRSGANRRIVLRINGHQSMAAIVGRGGVFHNGQVIWDSEGRGQLSFLEGIASSYSPNAVPRPGGR